MEAYSFNPDLVLEHNERAAVAQTVGTPGYKVIHGRIMRSEVDKFIVSLINAPEEDDSAIVAKHRLAKAAAQFFQAVTERINNEVQQYVAAVKASGPPVDPTEGHIDLGPAPSTFEDVDRDGQFTGEGEDGLSEY